MKRNINYGIAHSKSYKPSIVSEFACDRDEDGKVLKVHSDVYLLLRQKNIEKKVGANAIRDYIDSLVVPQEPRPNFTDDELFAMIEPRDIDNLTDAHKYAKYIQSRSDDIKAKYDRLVSNYKARYNKTEQSSVKSEKSD